MNFNRNKTSIIVLLLAVSLLVFCPIQMAKAQTTTVMVTPQSSTPTVGQTLTINITLNNVQNLYGVDVTLNWNPSYLSLQSNQSFVGISNGVLNNPTEVVMDTASQATGEYHLVAVSVNPATAFSGSGTIGTLKFTVTGAGQSSLTVSSTLANYAPNGGTSEPITHNDISGTVDATSSTSSASPSTSPTSSSSTSPTSSSSSSSSSSPSSSSPSPTAKVPEFSLIATLFIIAALAALAIVLAAKKNYETTQNNQPKNPQAKNLSVENLYFSLRTKISRMMNSIGC